MIIFKNILLPTWHALLYFFLVHRRDENGVIPPMPWRGKFLILAELERNAPHEKYEDNLFGLSIGASLKE